ncbi:enoyl-[acyl-carrier protein] reductase II [Alteribacillus persepolensis]|uniref:Probable nitronate monooxygenase n=1 Tax=Alteribacillus persepolensis TaxID=568899 RepID=A0A1G8KE00_9BACI|nr:nitronate monooxygenase [Alteribacillus persepolensis]SDI41060.1 enoyl-[acyl-carrier protein] reductase II [Alteribacillus persepolensis]
MELKSRITEQLAIDYPIIEGGMAHIGDGRLAAAVTNAGGLGQVAASGFSPRRFREQIDIAAQAANGSLGVNVPIGTSFNYQAYFEIIREKKDVLSAVSLSSGDPRGHTQMLKELGLTVMVVVASVRQAVVAEEAGADIIICEGFEAGGRNSPMELTLFTLIPSISKHVSLPVIAAGGISNGKAMLGAFALGAEGVQVGTRFIATEECAAHETYKRSLVEAKDEQSTVIERSIGSVNRVLMSPYVQEVQKREEKRLPFYDLFTYINGQRNRIAAIQGDMENGWVHAGQGIGAIGSITSVQNVIDEYIQDMKQAAKQLDDNTALLMKT